jgi:hypothetical protein
LCFDLKSKGRVYARQSTKFKMPFLGVMLHEVGLEKTADQKHTSAMTNKEIVQDLLRRIPDDASLQDIAQELEFIAAVREGLAELERGDSVPIEEVENELPSWIIR